MRRLSIFLTVFILVFSFTSTARAASLLVNTSSDNTIAGDGLCTLREAIYAAGSAGPSGDCNVTSNADPITFAGSYVITLTSPLPVINKTVTITGNGPANTIIEADACDPTILPDTCTHNRRVFDVDTGGSLTLNNLTIRHGRCDGSCRVETESGAGVFSQGTLTISDSVITDNSATDSGGGIFNYGIMTVVDSTLSGNIAGAWGGGIQNYNLDKLATLDHVTIIDNTAGSEGGGIHNESATLVLKNGTLVGGAGHGNTANTGGGILNFGWMTIDNSIVSANTATYGGGIANSNPLTIQNGSVIGGVGAGNVAEQGGGLLANYGPVTITGSIVSANSATTGSGILVRKGGPIGGIDEIVNVTSSCLIGNGGDSEDNTTDISQTAAGNWWGDPGGPNVGAADTTSGPWDTSGWLTAGSMACKGGAFKLNATASAQNQVSLSWTDAATDETGFSIEDSDDGSGWSFLSAVPANTTTFAAGALACEQIHHYRVRADSASGSSEWAQTSITMPDCMPAVGLSDTSHNFGSVLPGQTSAPFTVTVHNTGTGPLAITGLGIAPVTGDFSASIGACNTEIPERGSCDFSVTFHPTTPGAKSGTVTVGSNAPGDAPVLTLTGYGLNSLPAPALKSPKNGSSVIKLPVKFTWKSVKGAKGYHVRISQDSAFQTGVIEGDATKSTFSAFLPEFGLYYWEVASKDASGVRGGYSAPFSFTYTLNKSPKNGSLSKSTTPKFAWQAVRGASYLLEFSTDPGFPADTRTVRITTTKAGYPVLKATPLSHGLVYYWRLSTNGGTWTPTWSFSVK